MKNFIFIFVSVSCVALNAMENEKQTEAISAVSNSKPELTSRASTQLPRSFLTDKQNVILQFLEKHPDITDVQDLFYYGCKTVEKFNNGKRLLNAKRLTVSNIFLLHPEVSDEEKQMLIASNVKIKEIHKLLDSPHKDFRNNLDVYIAMVTKMYVSININDDLMPSWQQAAEIAELLYQHEKTNPLIKYLHN